MNFRFAAIVLSLLLAPVSVLGRRLLPYDPAVVECNGKLGLSYFPGPPNYESIREGDEREKVYLLELEEPFDIASAKDPKKRLNDLQGWGRNVKRIQLISEGALESHVGKKVVVKGQLFEGIFGHHHTRVLMSVTKITGE